MARNTDHVGNKDPRRPAWIDSPWFTIPWTCVVLPLVFICFAVIFVIVTVIGVPIWAICKFWGIRLSVVALCLCGCADPIGRGSPFDEHLHQGYSDDSYDRRQLWITDCFHIASLRGYEVTDYYDLKFLLADFKNGYAPKQAVSHWIKQLK